MKKFFLSIVILLNSASMVKSHVDHYSDFNYLEYELFRNNKSIGYHKYIFERNLNNLSVRSEVSFKITKLGVDIYNYFAESEEIFKDSKFLKFSSKTNQNKKNKYVNISLKEDKDLLIDGSSFKGTTSKDAIVGTWWNHEIFKAKAQISAISGRIIEQKVIFVGKEKIKLDNKVYDALHFNFLSSDETLPDKKKLNTHIWYDEKTFLWIKASFNKQGLWEYRLKVSK